MLESCVSKRKTMHFWCACYLVMSLHGMLDTENLPFAWTNVHILSDCRELKKCLLNAANGHFFFLQCTAPRCVLPVFFTVDSLLGQKMNPPDWKLANRILVDCMQFFNKKNMKLETISYLWLTSNFLNKQNSFT